MFSELDQVFQDILDGVSPAGRTRTARKIGLALRRSQQRRIASQKNPDGRRYACAAKFTAPSRGSSSSGIMRSGR
jgi:phage virion morphogenesis protein